jgi:hypothetical protein
MIDYLIIGSGLAGAFSEWHYKGKLFCNGQ